MVEKYTLQGLFIKRSLWFSVLTSCLLLCPYDWTLRIPLQVFQLLSTFVYKSGLPPRTVDT